MSMVVFFPFVMVTKTDGTLKNLDRRLKFEAEILIYPSRDEHPATDK